MVRNDWTTLVIIFVRSFVALFLDLYFYVGKFPFNFITLSALLSSFVKDTLQSLMQINFE